MHHHSDLGFAGLDPLAAAGFIAIFSFSFLASLHCVAMCAPLVCALLGCGKAVGRKGVAYYNLGRFISYPLAGSVLGGVGQRVLGLSTTLGQVLAGAVGIFLLTAAVAMLRGRGYAPQGGGSTFLRRLTTPIVSGIQKLPAPMAHVGLGLLTVVFPCMTLSPVLALAAGAGSALKGGCLLLAFQLGTLPAMVIAPGVPDQLLNVAGAATSRKIAPLFLVLAGLVTLYRAVP